MDTFQQHTDEESSSDALSPEEAANLVIQPDTLPTQDQAWLLQRWWSSLQGEDNQEWNQKLNNLNQDLYTIAQDTQLTVFKIIKEYLLQVLKVRVFPMSTEPILNWCVSLHAANPD